jgi:hypothetical protein
VAITPAAGNVGIVGALIIGAAAGFAKLHPWLPLAHAVVWVLSTWLLLRPALADPTAGRAYLWLAALGVAVVAGLPWLRNVFHGLVFALEGRHRVGDHLRVGDVSGRLVAIGTRGFTLRTPLGTEVTIPFATALTTMIERLNLQARDAPCELHVRVPAEVAVSRAVEVARLATSLSPFASPRCPPEVFVIAEEGDLTRVVLRVRGYVFDREHELRFTSDVIARLRADLRADA